MKQTIRTLLILIALHKVLLAGYLTDISSTTRGNSYWEKAIFELSVNKLAGSKLELRVTKIDGTQIKSAGEFTLREDRFRGNILMSTRTGGYSSYEEFEDIDMSKFSSYPKKLYVYYKPDAGGWAWVGAITVNKTADKPATISSASPSSMKEGLTNRNIYIYGDEFTDIEKVYIAGVVNTTNVRMYSSEKIRVEAPQIYGSGKDVPKGDRPVTIVFKNGKSVTKSGVFYVEDKAVVSNPTLSSLSPNRLKDGDKSQTIYIYGKDFTNISKVYIEGVVDTGKGIGSFELISATKIKVTSPLIHGSSSTVSKGYREVKVVFSNGKSVSKNSLFYVEDTPPPVNNGFPETAIKTKNSTSIYVNAQNNPFTRDSREGNYLIGQCTWYVYGRVMELVASSHLNQQVADDFKSAFGTGTGRHAKYWAKKLGIEGKGFSTNSKVLPIEKRKKGLLAIWNFGGYGHVGIVEDVGGANKEWYVLSDFNRADDTKYKRVKYKFDTSSTVSGAIDDKVGGVYPTFYELDVLTPNPNNNVIGIDLSDANGNVDMNRVKNDNKNIEFIFVKSTDGYPEGDDVNHEISRNFLQQTFKTNMDNALSLNIKVAPYHFIRPDYNPTIEGAKEEAIYFVKKIKSYYLNNKMLPPVIDVEKPSYQKENPNNRNQIDRWSRAEFTDWLLALSNKVEELLGIKPILYMSESFAQNRVDSRVATNMLWVAKYGTNNGKIGNSPSVSNWSQYDFWQYTSKGKVDGVDGDVDIDLFIGSVERLNQKLYQYKVIDTDKDGIPNDQDLDDDNDGISDIAEIANGLNPLDPTDATADNDEDGYTNAQEITSGTDINDANSKPTPSVTTRTITLSKGFGLYGMNSSMTLAQLIEKIGVDKLISINSNGETYQLSYVKEGLDMLNDFTQLEPFKSVWIEVANEVTITYDDIDYSNEEQEITLEGNRWYLLNPPKEISLETIKAQLGNSNIKVIQGISTTYQQQYIDDGIDWANDFTGFYEPLGYWILLKENATLKF
jgi:lysozyme